MDQPCSKEPNVWAVPFFLVRGVVRFDPRRLMPRPAPMLLQARTTRANPKRAANGDGVKDDIKPAVVVETDNPFFDDFLDVFHNCVY